MLYIKLLYSEKEENNLLKSFFVIKLTRNSVIHRMDNEGNICKRSESEN